MIISGGVTIGPWYYFTIRIWLSNDYFWWCNHFIKDLFIGSIILLLIRDISRFHPIISNNNPVIATPNIGPSIDLFIFLYLLLILMLIVPIKLIINDNNYILPTSKWFITKSCKYFTTWMDYRSGPSIDYRISC